MTLTGARRRPIAYRLLVAVLLAFILTPALAAGQAPVSAGATVRAEVLQACPGKSKKGKCKPRPPTGEDDEDDDDEDGAARVAGRSVAVQSILESAEATGIDGADVLPSRVTVWLADPNARPAALEWWSRPPVQDNLETDFAWLMMTHRLAPLLHGGNRVITIVAEY